MNNRGDVYVWGTTCKPSLLTVKVNPFSWVLASWPLLFVLGRHLSPPATKAKLRRPLFLIPPLLLVSPMTMVLPAQDVSGGKPVLVAGTDLPLWGMEIDAEEGRQEFMQSDGAGSSPGVRGEGQGGGGGSVQRARAAGLVVYGRW